MKLSYVLPIILLKEGKSFVAYSPAVDISTAGKTAAQAKKRFIDASMLFFEGLLEMGTVDEALRDLGWTKVKKSWEPPKLVQSRTERVRIPVSA